MVTDEAQRIANEAYGVTAEQQAEASEREAEQRRAMIAVLETKGRLEIPEMLGGGYVQFKREVTFGQSLEMERAYDQRATDDAYYALALRYCVRELGMGDGDPQPIDDPLALGENLGAWLVLRLMEWRAAVAWEALDAGKAAGGASD